MTMKKKIMTLMVFIITITITSRIIMSDHGGTQATTDAAASRVSKILSPLNEHGGSNLIKPLPPR